MTTYRLASDSNRSITHSYRLRMDRVGRAHVRLFPSAARNSERFSNIQKSLLNGSLTSNSPSCQFALSLICFDGVLTKSDLIAALSNSKSIYAWDGNICIDWADKEKRINRRALSQITVNAWLQMKEKPFRADTIITEIETLIVDLYPSGGSSTIDVLFDDAQAWTIHALPGPIYAHCLNIIPLSCLPRSTLARQSSRLALDTCKDSHTKNLGRGFCMALDGAFSLSGRNSSGWLVSRIVEICKHKKSMAPHSDKKRMLKNCLELTTSSSEAGMISSLLLAWAVDLIESGTRVKHDISPKTIHKYVSCIAVQLFSAFNNIDIFQCDPDDFASKYIEICISTKPGNQKSTAVAINNWHSFLTLWFDVLPLTTSLYHGIATSIPRANVVWSHELNTIHEWLDTSLLDERTSSQMRVCLAIACKMRIRISELLRLRLWNIRIYQHGLEIEISPMRRDGKLKSASSRRVVQIKDETAIQTISNWKKRRELENALPTDLFFGDPHSPTQGYRFGFFCYAINQMIKYCTGDDSASFHTLSHTWISFMISEALLLNSEVDINALDEISAAAGHASSQTSLVHYFHLPELVIRYFFDKYLKSINWTGHMVSLHSNISAAAFRQRCARSGGERSRSEVAWNAIIKSPLPPISDVMEQFLLSQPPMPAFLKQPRQILFSDVLNVVSDLAEGMSASVISVRTGQPEEVVHQIASVGCEVLEQLRILDKSGVSTNCTGRIIGFHKVFLGSSGHHIQFNRINHMKLRPLVEFFERNEDASGLEVGVNSWIGCYHNGYISLESMPDAIGLVGLLQSACISNQHLAVSIASAEKAPKSNHNVLTVINSAFSSFYPLPPITIFNARRRGRPSAYLSISRSSGDDFIKPGSAALSCAGLNALMLTAAIYLKVNSHLHDTSFELPAAAN